MFCFFLLCFYSNIQLVDLVFFSAVSWAEKVQYLFVIISVAITTTVSRHIVLIREENDDLKYHKYLTHSVISDNIH